MEDKKSIKTFENSNARFCIKPFKWVGDIKEDGDEIYTLTPFGNYTIKQKIGGAVMWKYDFGYPDEDNFYAEDIESAKVSAFKHWFNRISNALVKC